MTPSAEAALKLVPDSDTTPSQAPAFTTDWDTERQERELPSHVPIHLVMATTKGNVMGMTPEDAIKNSIEPDNTPPIDLDSIQLTRQLDMAVNARRMTREHALRCMGYKV